MQRTKRKTILPVLSALLLLIAITSAAITAQTLNVSNGLSILGSAFIAPGAAFEAGEKYIAQQMLQQEENVQNLAQEQGGGTLSELDTQQSEPLNINENSAENEANSTEIIDGQDTVQSAEHGDASQESTQGTAVGSEGEQEGTQSAATNSEVPPQPMPESGIPIIPAFYEQGTSSAYVQTGSGSIRNFTNIENSDIAQYVGQALPFTVEANSEEPQVLIMHTHATESFVLDNNMWVTPEYTARSTDNSVNITSIGKIITENLNAAGINTLHDVTLHDYPSYTGSYDRSYETVQSYLQQYPSIKVVIDVHRDALYKSDGSTIKPVVNINGEDVAQVMLISCADNGGNLPNYTENLKFAAAWEAKMEEMYPGLTRPVLFDERYYNQDLTTGSLLLEVGGHVNTLDEAKNAAQLVSETLIAVLVSY